MKEFEYQFSCIDHDAKKCHCVKVIVFYNDDKCNKLWNPSDVNRVQKHVVKNSVFERVLYEKVTSMLTTTCSLNDYSLVTLDKIKMCKHVNMNQGVRSAASNWLPIFRANDDNISFKNIYSTTIYKVKYSRGKCCADGNWTQMFNYDKHMKLYVFSCDKDGNLKRLLNSNIPTNYTRSVGLFRQDDAFDRTDLGVSMSDLETENFSVIIGNANLQEQPRSRVVRVAPIAPRSRRVSVSGNVQDLFSRLQNNAPDDSNEDGFDLRQLGMRGGDDRDSLVDALDGLDALGDEDDGDGDDGNGDDWAKEEWNEETGTYRRHGDVHDIYRQKYLKYKNKYSTARAKKTSKK
jgi:hypothetical protein